MKHKRALNQLHSEQNLAWRDPAQVIAAWKEAGEIEPLLMKANVRGKWWDVLESKRAVLLVTREYEHLVLAMHASSGKSNLSYIKLPHPSGLVVDRKKNRVHIASTRNPNQIFEFKPVGGFLERDDHRLDISHPLPLFPSRSRFYPGCLYLHDLAIVGGQLYGNSVGQNSVVRIHEPGGFERVWWPKCIETKSGPVFSLNLIQLNSIGAGKSLRHSYFSASADVVTKRRPGHRNYPVDRRGVVFDGRTREPVATGLTRPHSVRLHKGKIWVDNSGYGEFGYLEKDKFVPVVKLPGWTRGLCFIDDVAFVGTSRILPRFKSYAPGVDDRSAVCGIYAVDIRNGAVLGSIAWPFGNQIFAIDWISSRVTSGFPFLPGKTNRQKHSTRLFYGYNPNEINA